MHRVSPRRRQSLGRGAHALAFFVVVLAIVSVPAASGIGTAAAAAGAAAATSGSGPVVPSAAPTAPPSVTAHAPTPGAAATATLTVSPTSGPAGTLVTLEAAHFAHGSTFTISYNSTDACSGSTTSKGYFNCTYTIPNMESQVLEFAGEDGPGHIADANFTLVTFLSVTPSSGLVGTDVLLHGSGFGGKFVGKTSPKTPVGFPVQIKWAGGSVCYANTTAYGEFNCTFAVPASAAGAFLFNAISLNLSYKANATFTVTSGLAAGPTFGPDGTTVTFTGTGFAAGASVWVNWSDGNACQSTVSGTGGFSCDFTIPGGTAGGSYTFTAVDSSKDTSAASFEVSYLETSPLGGPVGTTINFTAGGFTPLVPITVTWDGGTACSGGDTTVTGTYACQLVLPAAVAGPHTFTATDTDGLTASAIVTVQPVVTVSPGYGAPGRAETFNGTGFGASVAATVTDPNGTVCTSTTDAVGSFTCGFTLPVTTPGGAVPFTAEDADDNLATVDYYVTNLTIAPSVGPVNTETNLTGAGYAPNAAYTIKWGATTVCTGTTTASGSFKCAKPLHIPWAVVGPHVLSASDGSDGDSGTAVFTVTPGLTSNRSSVTSGELLKFNSSGFAADSEVAITWTFGTFCSGLTSALGSLNCTVAFPAVPVGAYVFTATDGSGHTGNATVTVGPQLLFSPTSGPSGTVVSINATGFSAEVTIAIASSLGTACSGTTNAFGAFVCTYTVPPTPSALYPFTATDANSHHAAAHFVVDPTLKLSLTAGPVGSVVTFSGTGYVASHPVNVSWANGLACSGTSSALGSFSCLFAIPSVTSGTYEFTAKDTPAGSDLAFGNFTVIPSLTVDPTAGPVGTSVTFAGAGFVGVTLVVVNWSGGLVCSVTTGTNGAFSCGYTIPPTAAGAHSFTATPAAGSPAQATFTVAPVLVPTPATGPVGTEITFNGAGFAPDAAVDVSWTGGLGCTATTSAAGSFNCSLTMPAAPYGATEFTATDGYSASTNFTVVPQLIPNPTAALDGATVDFTGTGFAASVGVSVTWPSGAACASTTDADGTFSCSFALPTGTPGGTYPFTATDADDHSAITSVTVATKLTVGPGRGDVPISVTFNGTGFGASDAVSVTWTAGTACSTTTSASGTFSCSYTIPSGTAGGNYTFTATDAAMNTASTRFVVTFLTLSPTGAVAGSTVHFSAGGFASNSSFSITWTGGTACSGTTTATGSFSCAYAIPSGTTPGSYTFTAKDGTGGTATATFDVFGIPTVTAVTANLTGVDIDQPVKFTASVSGGSGTYTTYAWAATSGDLGCAFANTASIVCTPTTMGNYNVSVAVTDSDDVSSARTTSANLTVSPDPTVNTPTANLTGADVGQSVKFSVVAGSGNGTLSYLWNGLPTGCSGAAATIVCVPTAAVTDARVSVTVTDSNDFSVRSAAISFNVSADPTISSPGANRTSADVGQPVTFSVTASGGYGALSFVWSGLPTGCAGTTSVVSCTPTASVLNAQITATVVDANGFRVTSSALTFTVYADPTVSTPTATHASVDLGESVQFSTSASGGYGTLSYTWANLPTGCAGSTPVITCTPAATESGASVTVTVKDANGFSVTSAALTFSVYSDPTANKPSATAVGADIGQSVDFTAVVDGGSGAFTYVWSGLPTGCAGTTSTVDCDDVSTAGTFSVSYKATDTNGYSATSTALTFVVDVDPTVGTPSVNVSSADVGQAVNFSVSASAGAGGFTYVWNGLPSGCTGTGAFVDCAPTAPATQAMITVTVTDLNGYGLTSGALVFTVFADPSLTAPSAAPKSADVGQTVTFSTVLSGGAGSPEYTWSGLPSGCTVSGDSATCADLPTAETLSISVSVVDANEFRNSSATTDFSVLSDPTASTPVPSASSVDVGQSVTFTTTVAGGAGGYVYAWSGLPSGCSGTTNPLVCTPTTAGASDVSVKVTDANGVSSTTAAVTVTVYSDPTVDLGATPSTLLLGKSIFLHGIIANGSGGFTFSWSGLPGGCSATNAATLSCTPSSTGTFTIELSVKDSDGRTASDNVTVTVNAAFLGLPAAEGEAIVGGIVALALIGLVVFVVVRRRRRPASSSPVPWAPSPGTPPAPQSPPPVEPAWSPPPLATPPAPTNGGPDSWEMPAPEPGAPETDAAGPSSLPSEDHST